MTLTALPEDTWYVKKPALFIAAKRDYVSRPYLFTEFMAKFVQHGETVELDSGHWLQMEATAEVNNTLERWLESVVKL